jgi:hypothetical protein
MNILINGFIVLLVVVVTTWLSNTFPIFGNGWGNLFFWSVIVGLFVGFASKEVVLYRR